MNQLPGWSIGKDNKVKASPYELRQLKGKYRPTGRTLFVECPNYQDVDQTSARIIAEFAKSSAKIGGCSYIVVKGPRWRHEFNLMDLTGEGKWWGKRPGMVENPLDLQQAGSFFDTTQQLHQVPPSFNVREKKVFPVDDSSTQDIPGI